MTLRITPSRYRRNIANEIAHGLLDEITPEHPQGCESSIERNAVRVTLVLDRHWEPADEHEVGMPFSHTISGFATLFVASVREWKHRSRQTFIRERMPQGWQPEDLARSIFEAMEEIRHAEVTASWRERVFDEMQAREISEVLPERVDGHTTRFEEMTQEDCEFWIDWLSRLPLQPFVYKAPLPWRPGSASKRQTLT